MTREQLVELSRHRRQMQTAGGVWHDAVPWEFIERLAAPAQAEPAAPEWRCFHCNEVFTNAAAASEHFGSPAWNGAAKPGCQIDLAEFRRMEATIVSFHEEDTDLHREIATLRSGRDEAVRRAEEAGYQRGLDDAKKHPEELGLTPATPSARPTPAAVPTEEQP